MAPRTRHRFCTLHRIAYDATLDPTCPQCTLGGIQPQEQLNFDIVEQKPLNSAGKPVDPITLS
jgi:hypothetical protein